MPYDSASEYYRTYEGAPDSTLGAVTPLLSYPLGVPMSERAKRTQLRQAVRRLLAEGPGAMMGSTLLSVDAAELGDRALLDSLLPHSYQGSSPGPVPDAVRDSHQRRGELRDRRRRISPAGDLTGRPAFGSADAAWSRPSSRCCRPRIKRLVLRNVFSRGRRYDVIVDSTGRRMVPHGRRRAT